MLSPSSKICVLGEETWQAAGTSSSIVINWDLRFMLHHVKGRTQDIFRTECKLPIGRREQRPSSLVRPMPTSPSFLASWWSGRIRRSRRLWQGRRWWRSGPGGQSAQRLGDRHDLVLDPVDPPSWSQSATTAWSTYGNNIIYTKICDNFYDTMISY